MPCCPGKLNQMARITCSYAVCGASILFPVRQIKRDFFSWSWRVNEWWFEQDCLSRLMENLWKNQFWMRPYLAGLTGVHWKGNSHSVEKNEAKLVAVCWCLHVVFQKQIFGQTFCNSLVGNCFPVWHRTGLPLVDWFSTENILAGPPVIKNRNNLNVQRQN